MRARLPRIGLYASLAIILLIVIFPFWWMVDTSLKHPVDIFGGVTLYPHNPTGDNYAPAVRHVSLRRRTCMNSVIVVTVSVAVSLTIGTLAAYSAGPLPSWRGGSTSRRSWWRCSCG